MDKATAVMASLADLLRRGGWNDIDRLRLEFNTQAVMTDTEKDSTKSDMAWRASYGGLEHWADSPEDAVLALAHEVMVTIREGIDEKIKSAQRTVDQFTELRKLIAMSDSLVPKVKQ